MTLQVFSPDTDGKIQVEIRLSNGYDPAGFEKFKSLGQEVVRAAMSSAMVGAIRSAMVSTFFDKGSWYTVPFAPIKWIAPFGDFDGEDKVIVRILFPAHGRSSNGATQRFVESLAPSITGHFPMWKKGDLSLVGVQVGFLDMYIQESRERHYAQNDATQGRALVAGASRYTLSAPVQAARDMDAQEGLPFTPTRHQPGLTLGSNESSCRSVFSQAPRQRGAYFRIYILYKGTFSC